jgi:DNA-directed RNA polymerase subunit RPC12/RpoP
MSSSFFFLISFLKKCTDDQIKFDALSENDIKKICIEVRKISKGETISYGYKCQECNIPIEDEVNLTKHQVIRAFDATPIKVNDKLILTFKDLSYKTSEELYNKYGTSDKKFTYYYIINSIDSITYEDKTYTTFTEQEVIDFLDRLDPNEMAIVYDKFDSKVSSVELKRNFKCFKCKKPVEVEFGDLLSFLVF